MNHAHQFLQQAFEGNAQTHYVLPESWAQGRAGFGGLVAGMMVAAMRRDVNLNHVLRSMSCTFAGPVTIGEPFSIETQLIRSGKSAIQMQACIRQNDEIRTMVMATFAQARESAAIMPTEAGPEVPAPEHLPPIPPLANFIQNFDVRWVFGGLPFFGEGTREMGGWWHYKTFDVAPDLLPVLSESHYITLLDAWPPAVLPLIKKMAPASSMTWFAQFVQPLPMFNNDWLLYRTQIAHAADGYGQTQAHIWDANGRLLVVSSQTVSVFD